MSDETILAPDASVLGRPNSYIGRSIPRPNARRLLTGQGRFVDDILLAGQAYGVVLRSPVAHARIATIDTDAAVAAPGVLSVLTGADVAASIDDTGSAVLGGDWNLELTTGVHHVDFGLAARTL